MSWQLGATVFGTGLTIFTWVASMMGLPIPRLVLGLLLVGSLWLMAVWPVAWLVRVSSGYKTQLIICAIVGAILTSLSYGIIEYSLLPSETPTVQTGVQPQPPLRSTYNLFEPVVELGIGKPFDSSTLITIKNAGVEPIIHVAANLRCFFLKTDKDMVPDLFFEGFPSIGNANSWWSIDVIEPNGIETKDAMESVTRCLSNSEKHPGRVFARQIFSIDLSYRRSGDNKEYKLSGIANLAKDHNTGKPFLWPENMSEFYRQMLESRTAPAFSVKP